MLRTAANAYSCLNPDGRARITDLTQPEMAFGDRGVGSGPGGANWAHVASLIETCKLNGVEPQRYLAEVMTRLVNSWPQARIDELMPWHGTAQGSG